MCRGLLSENDARRATPFNETILEKLSERVKIVDYLHKNGGSIADYDRDGLTPLMYACSSGNTELVRYLLDEQVKNDTTALTRILNERSSTGETCFMYAIESGNCDIVTFLCHYDAHLHEQKSPSYVTAAAFYGHAQILEKLIQSGLDVNEFGKIIE